MERRGWIRDENSVYIEGIDISKYDPKRVYDKETYDRLVKELKDERKKFLENYPNLNPVIKNALNLEWLKNTLYYNFLSYF